MEELILTGNEHRAQQVVGKTAQFLIGITTENVIRYVPCTVLWQILDGALEDGDSRVGGHVK